MSHVTKSTILHQFRNAGHLSSHAQLQAGVGSGAKTVSRANMAGSLAPPASPGTAGARPVRLLFADSRYGEVASHASALKAHRQNVKRRLHNRELRATLRSALKGIRAALDRKDLAVANAQLNQTVSLIDKLASKGIIHHNAAARYKSRISARLVKTTAA
jgi:small subunit ribosomal protein S20